MKNQKGITLIALVITIIVLLILAGVSIAMLTGENGILTQANSAKSETAKQEAVEKINLELNAVKAKIYERIVKYSNYEPESDLGGTITLVNGLDQEISKMLQDDTVTFSTTATDADYTWKITNHKLIISYVNETKEVALTSGQIDLTSATDRKSVV